MGGADKKKSQGQLGNRPGEHSCRSEQEKEGQALRGPKGAIICLIFLTLQREEYYSSIRI